MTVAIVDYGSGNLHSAAKAFERAARSLPQPEQVLVTRDPERVWRADRVVLPGVGAFADCRAGLDAIDGMVGALDRAVREKARPFFGICVGMQLMAERGNEYRVTPGLGWIAGEVKRLETRDPSCKVPHMGWNGLTGLTGQPILAGMGEGTPMYFTHSFAFYPADEGDVAAWVDHGGRFPAAVARGNVAGVQFHPEKSQGAGLSLLARFLEWRP